MDRDQLTTRVRESISGVSKMAAAGASLAEIARELRVPEHVLTALAERYLSFGRSKHGSAAALDHAAKAPGVTREMAMARILAASFGSIGG